MSNIITWEKLVKIRRKIDSLRNRIKSIRSSELVKIALSLGREKVNRGKEPTYERSDGFPLTIPSHPGTLPVGTAASILDQLEEDIERLETEISNR